jgi:4-aminobutyrate aminotransferase-like enzyme
LRFLQALGSDFKYESATRTLEDIVCGQSGLGLLLGIEMVKDRDSREPANTEPLQVAEGMRQECVLIKASGRFGNVIKLPPPPVS